MEEGKGTQVDQECERSNQGQSDARQSSTKKSMIQQQSIQTRNTEHQNPSQVSYHQPASNQQQSKENIRSRSRRSYNIIANAQIQIGNLMKNELFTVKSSLESQIANIRKDSANMNSKIDLILNILRSDSPKEYYRIEQPRSEYQQNLIGYNKVRFQGYAVAPNQNLHQVEKISQGQFTTRKRQSSRSRSRERSCSCTCCMRLIQSRKKGRRQRKSSSDSQESNYSGKMTAEQVRMIVYRLRTGTLSVQDAARKCGRRECVILAWLNVY